MKSRLLFTTSPLMLLMLLVVAIPLIGQEQQPTPVRYRITDLGTLGGAYSYAYGINDRGVVAGGAATPTESGGVAQTAFLWDDDLRLINLGTLGGMSCPDCSSEAGGPNASGESALISETGQSDANGEDFCGFGTHRQCLGAIWKNGTLTALPTLEGGNNDQAYWLNNRGEVIGFSENGTYDSTCAVPFQVLRFEAVKWSPEGKIQRLSPVKGDTVAFGFGINDNGEAVGSSGLCSNTTLPPVGPSGLHAVLWERDGSPTDLGSLSGAAPNVATSINNRGEVVGTSPFSDGTVHAFRWTRQSGMKDLGTLPGAVATIAPCCHTINDHGEVVGFSIDATGNPRAVVWRAHRPIDLNTLIAKDSPWFLLQALSINNAGQIVGIGTINGNVHAFLATSVCQSETDEEPSVAPPEADPELPQGLRLPRFGAHLTEKAMN
jgi:probable HAF family extracellular repeat protein